LYLLTICSWVFGIFEEKVFFMHSQKLGSKFELITKDFFIWLFEELNYKILKDRIQFSGTQDGFDILLIVDKDYVQKRIFIECKNYSKDLDIGNIHKKLFDLENNYELNEGDLFIAINPKSNFKNQDNPEKIEPRLNSKYQFNIILLDISNGIKELFSLNNDFFKEIYNENKFDLPETNEIEIINRFKKNIFSKKPFKRIILNEELKEKFIGNLKIDDNFLDRDLKLVDNNELEINFQLNKVTLTELLSIENRIVLIGNPGSGKSTELKKIAIDFWSNKKEVDSIIIFKSLKNFTTSDLIESYLPRDWDIVDNQLILFDGLDEIVDIENFISKLESFVSKNKRVKFILSCRTNIFEKVVKEISDFKPFRLEDLIFEQGIILLNNKIDNYIKYDIFNNNLIIDFLKNPFQINLLADYINRNKSLPNNNLVLWESYVESRLSNDRNEKFKRTSLNIPIIKKCSSKISLINELMKSNLITEENIFDALNQMQNDFSEFLKTPFLDKNTGKEEYFFEHRNIQEYFAALLLSKYSFEKILNIILINGSNKINPSLYNTVTFLINILEGDKQLELIEWFVTNQPELLFKADKNRIDSHKVKVFQDFFNHHCIEKSYWITTNNQLTVKEIAEFGDCLENYEYLINLIDSEKHFRVTISAIEILNFFQPIIYNKSENLKEYLLNKIKCSELSKEIKSHLINCIYVHKFHHNGDYLRLIFENFYDESHKELNNSLLRLINDCNNVDEYFWFIKNEFEFENEIKPRVKFDNVIRGNRWLLDDIIVKIKSSDYFLKIAYYIFSEEFNFYIDTTFENEFLEKCIEFSNNEDNFLEKLLDSIKNKMHFYSFEKKFNRIFNSISQAKQNQVYKYLITNFKFNEVEYFLATVTNNQNVSIIVAFFIKNKEQHSPDFFRNVMFNSGQNELALEFEKDLKNKGVSFLNLISIEGIIARKKLISDKPQINFDLLFNKKELLSDIQNIFTKYNVLSFDNQIRYEIESEWYEENGHDNVIDISYSLLSKIFINKKNVTIVDVEEYINSEINILEEIKNLIIRNKSFTHKFLIKTQQSKFIENLCQEISKKIDFSQIIISKTLTTFSLGSDHNIWKLILFFDNELNLKLSTDFYLNSLEFFDYSLSNFENDLFEKLVYKIDDKSTVDSKVVSNINYKVLFSFGLEKHIKYVIENELNEAYEKIKEIIYLNDDSLINKYIESIYLKSDDLNFLLKCSENIETDKCWTSIKLLSKMDSFQVYCESKSKEYIDTIEKRESNYYLFNAISCLFEVNSINAINYYIKLIQLKKYDYLHSFGKLNYSIIEDFGLINELFDLAYSFESRNNYTNDVGSFLNNLIHNLSSKNTAYNQKVNEKLEEIKNGLSDSNMNYDSKLFYINLLIDKNADCLLNLLSKPLDFKDALKKVEEILN
jgi:hypothetical protein